MKKELLFNYLTIVMFFIMGVGFASCGSDNSKDNEEEVDQTQEYLNKLYGSWELISRVFNGENSDLTYYKQIRTFTKDNNCHVVTYDYSIKKEKVTPESKPTETFDISFKIYKERTSGKYILYTQKPYSNTYIESYYYIEFENDGKILNISDKDRKYYATDDKYKKI